jgi:hypothetical protein
MGNTSGTGAVIPLRQNRTVKELPPGEGNNSVEVVEVPLVSRDVLESEVHSGVRARMTPHQYLHRQVRVRRS